MVKALSPQTALRLGAIVGFAATTRQYWRSWKKGHYRRSRCAGQPPSTEGTLPVRVTCFPHPRLVVKRVGASPGTGTGTGALNPARNSLSRCRRPWYGTRISRSALPDLFR